MVPALCALICAQTPLGMVRVAQGEVQIGQGARSASAQPGALLYGDSWIDTGVDGWTELHLLHLGRVRISAQTRAQFVPSEDSSIILSLERGRVWAQISGGRKQIADRRVLAVRFPRHRALLVPGSSVILERTLTGGTSVFARTGTVLVMDGVGGRARVQAGRGLQIPPSARTLPKPTNGGRGTGELVVLETEKNMGDLFGLRAFLLTQVLDAKLGVRSSESLTKLHYGEKELSGSETGPVGKLVEQGFRPPPFFESEVPPKGPNVQVEVRFADD